MLLSSGLDHGPTSRKAPVSSRVRRTYSRVVDAFEFRPRRELRRLQTHVPGLARLDQAGDQLRLGDGLHPAFDDVGGTIEDGERCGGHGGFLLKLHKGVKSPACHSKTPPQPFAWRTNRRRMTPASAGPLVNMKMRSGPLSRLTTKALVYVTMSTTLPYLKFRFLS